MQTAQSMVMPRGDNRNKEAFMVRAVVSIALILCMVGRVDAQTSARNYQGQRAVARTPGRAAQGHGNRILILDKTEQDAL